MTVAILCSVLFDLPILLNVLNTSPSVSRVTGHNLSPSRWNWEMGKWQLLVYSLLVTACRSAPVSPRVQMMSFSKHFIFSERFQSKVCELFRNLLGHHCHCFSGNQSCGEEVIALAAEKMEDRSVLTVSVYPELYQTETTKTDRKSHLWDWMLMLML